MPQLDYDIESNVKPRTSTLETNLALLVAWDTISDMVRLLVIGGPGESGYGVLAVSPRVPGSSEVLSVRGTTDSTVAVVLGTPTLGKRIRVISVEFSAQVATQHNFECYFGSGVDITTNAGKEIAEPALHLTNSPNGGRIWADGAGPVGAVDDVVSIRSSVALGAATIVHLKYREE